MRVVETFPIPPYGLSYCCRRQPARPLLSKASSPKAARITPAAANPGPETNTCSGCQTKGCHVDDRAGHSREIVLQAGKGLAVIPAEVDARLDVVHMVASRNRLGIAST